MATESPRDISARKRGRVPAAAPDEALDMLFENTPIPMLLLDTEGHVCQNNRAAQEALAGFAIGNGDLGIALSCVHSAKHPDGCGPSPLCRTCSLRGLVALTVKTGRTHRQVEVKVAMRHDRKQRDCYLLVSTAVSDLPEGRRILVCMEDITARKRAELRLQKALQEVEQLRNELQQDNSVLREEIRHLHDFEEIVGNSEELKLTLQKTEHVATTDANVLILGETGTGKELIARAIHYRSPRKDRPLVTINCAALSGNLIESELFGHVAGSFTGAVAKKVGRFELAHGGTIFLDEIGELTLELQAKLLRVLQNGQFERVGSSDTQTVDVRVIAATNRDLKKAMSEEVFRSDLYYRLAVFPIEVPPLRARRQDIPLLIWHFVTNRQAQLGKRFESIPKAVMNALTRYEWPGNVRELENVVERAMILSRGPVLQLGSHLPLPVTRRKTVSSREDIETVERAHITEVLEDCGWKIKGEGNAADRLGLNPSTLRSRMKKLGITRP